MRQGCISLGEVRCDNCHQVVPYLERYLVIDEKDGVESAEGTPSHCCVKCCLEKGYAHVKTEKDEEVVTFFSE
ncbi:MAG: hypothetical protein PHU08_07920 [Dehalococcoidales bacterium]|nr:hypothetical protein [Dehalococcoidales bacterium]